MHNRIQGTIERIKGEETYQKWWKRRWRWRVGLRGSFTADYGEASGVEHLTVVAVWVEKKGCFGLLWGLRVDI